MIAREKERAGRYRSTAEQVVAEHADSQTEDGPADSQSDGLRALLALAVERAGNLVEEAASHDGRALTVLENLTPAPDVRAPQVEPDGKQKSGRAANRGAHQRT